MIFEQGPRALAIAERKMQKAAYYDNAGLFGGYTYSKADAYPYGAAHQPYGPAGLDGEYPASACSVQGSAPGRGPAHKGSELNGSCMRTAGGGPGGSQPPGMGEQQPPALPPSSPPNPPSAPPPKKAKGGPNSSGSSTATLSKQIFPWMKESRQNSKQKSTCPPSGSRPTPAPHIPPRPDARPCPVPGAQPGSRPPPSSGCRLGGPGPGGGGGGLVAPVSLPPQAQERRERTTKGLDGLWREAAGRRGGAVGGW